MATIAPNPGKYRAFDDNGDPLSGGFLYTYEAGTTTPKDTYTGADGNTANSNPVELDDAGYANIWLGDGGYKFTLKDANNAEIFTVDNIGGSSDTAFGGQVNAISVNTLITSVYANSVNICTGSPTLSLMAAADAGEGFYFSVKNQGVGTVTIDPDGAELIDGSATRTLAPGYSALVICNGTTWYTLFFVPIVPISGGGTGQTTQTAGFDALSPTTTKGDLIVDNGTNAIRVAVGATQGMKLIVDSAQASGVKWANSYFTKQYLITGTGATYTTPAGCTKILVQEWAGGGGGGATITNAGSAGGNTTFNSIVANGGSGGGTGGVGLPGLGGTGGTGTADYRANGNPGFTNDAYPSGAIGRGGNGGAGIGGAGRGGNTSAAGGAAAVNTGSGGGGAGTSAGSNGGAGGGAGEYAEFSITAPAASYTYTVGTSGAGGTAGTFAGGAGGTGLIIVTEFY